jgi:hypothetical protein
MNIEQFSKEHLSAVLGASIRVKGGEIDEYCLGICWNVDYLTDMAYDAYDVISEVSPSWPKHSGRKGFPIEESYDANIWIGTQGALRYELLDFLIDELTKVVNNGEQKIACTIELFEGGFTNDQQ